MGILDRAIRRGISEGVGKAVGAAVEKVVAPKANEYANRAAEQLDRATGRTARQTPEATGGLNGAFANLQRAAEGYATEMSKSIKICPSCGEATDSERKFCPSCGAKLPEETVAQGAVCPSCGKQNTVGVKFCSDCGTKLPAAEAEERAAEAANEAAMARWDTLLPQYPKWSFGGREISLTDEGEYVYAAISFPRGYDAAQEVRQYRQLLEQSGFRQAGQHPDPCHLYKRADGAVYHVDTEHCFDGGSDNVCLYFNIEEPTGGFDYVKSEPAAKLGAKDIFGLFK